MPRDVDGSVDEIDELVDWQMDDSPACRRQFNRPVWCSDWFPRVPQAQ